MPITLSPSEIEAFTAIERAIETSNTFFIAGHLKPDGDTIGSGLALRSVLSRLGKNVEMYSRDPLPVTLKSLACSDNILFAEKSHKHYDCAIILECSGLERMGDIISASQAKVVINIDHHAHFNNFGNINYIDPKASSTAEIIYKLFVHFKHKLTVTEAEHLWAGIVTDSGMFQQTNTTPVCLQVAAELVSIGVKPNEMFQMIYSSKTLSSLNLLGLSLQTMQLACGGTVAYLRLEQEMFKAANSNVTEAEDFINYTMQIPGVKVGVLFREETAGSIKVSFRSRQAYDVNAVARQFAGGGHKNAAGCTIAGNMDSVITQVLAQLSLALS
jgi:phosphoesterase RecJ-like protein